MKLKKSYNRKLLVQKLTIIKFNKILKNTQKNDDKGLKKISVTVRHTGHFQHNQLIKIVL